VVTAWVPPSLTTSARRDYTRDKIIATAFHTDRIVRSAPSRARWRSGQRERALPLAAGAAAGEPRRHGTHLDGEEHPRCGVGRLAHGRSCARPSRRLTSRPHGGFATTDNLLILHTAFHLHGAAGCTHAPSLLSARVRLVERARTKSTSRPTSYRRVYDLLQGGPPWHTSASTQPTCPSAAPCLPLARFESNSEHLQNAQRRYSLIESNEQCMIQLQSCPTRYGT